MNQERKNKLIKLISELRDAAIAYGGIADKVQGGAYIRDLVIKARQKDMDETMQAILDYLKTL
jgi:hypothetical protein